MPKTSATDLEFHSNNRFNPYITKGINKNLLTPCRQVGLCRKRKTPNSDKSFEISITNTQVNSNSNSPATSKSTEKSDQKQESKLIKKDIKKKSSVSKCLIINENEKVKSSLEVITLNETSKLVELKEKHEGESKSLKKSTILSKDSGGNKDPIKINKSQEHTKKCEDHKSRKSKEALREINKELGNNILQCEDALRNNRTSKPTKTCTKEKQEPHTSHEIINKSKKHSPNDGKKSSVLRELSKEKNKADQNSTKDYILEKNHKEIANNNVQIKCNDVHIIKVDPMVEHDYTRSAKKKTKLKRSLSMKKTFSDEQDNRKSPLDLKNSPVKESSVQLQSLDSKETVSDVTVNNINKLEKEVEIKRKLVENLKQAEIYKKLHDVNQLKQLTATWKTGCISALNDLLPHLQAHGNIDMAMLLNNLQIPEKLITISDNGDLM